MDIPEFISFENRRYTCLLCNYTTDNKYYIINAHTKSKTHKTNEEIEKLRHQQEEQSAPSYTEIPDLRDKTAGSNNNQSMPDDEYKYKILEEIKNLSKANNDIMNEISENNKKLFELVQINQELQLKLISSL